MKCALSVVLLLSSCGPSPAPAPTMPPPTTDSAFNDVAPVIWKNCAKCHNGSFQRAFDPSNFKSSQALALLSSGAMPPPPNQISNDDKAALISYLTK